MFIGYIIFGVVALISWAISANLQSKFKKYSKIPIPYGIRMVEKPTLSTSQGFLRSMTFQKVNFQSLP